MTTETSDTQTVTAEPQQVNDVLRKVFSGGNPAPQQTPAAPAANAQPEKKAETPPAPPAPPAPEAKKEEIPPVEPPAPTAPAVDPYEAVVSAVASEAPVVATWNDEAKGLLKATFGVEDPDHIKTQLTQAELMAKELEELKPIKSAIEGLSPVARRVVELALAGRATEAQEYLKSAPAVVIENKKAEELTDRQLVDTYLPGKITAEQWEMLNDPEADSEMVDALKERVKILRDAAADRHEMTAEQARLSYENEVKSRNEIAAEVNRSVAETIAKAKESPLRAFVDQGAVTEISTGAFIRKYVTEKGALTPEAATLHLKALHFDHAVKFADARGYQRGREAALLEAASRQPSVPSTARRDPGDVPMNTTPDEAARQVLFRVLSGS